MVQVIRRGRLLSKNGTFNVQRRGFSGVPLGDLYHTLLSLSTPRFLAIVIILYVTVNLMFACAYLACGPGALGGVDGVTLHEHFLSAFFFSVQTLATIGYGRITPVSLGANLLVSAEALTGLMGLAIATGLLFARFSRPTARVSFSHNAIIANHDGIPSLFFRMANERFNQIVEAEVSVSVSRLETTAEGEVFRDFYDLKVERAHTQIFALTWTIVHPITPDSPLYGATRESLLASSSEIVVSVVGIDETFSQAIHARSSYTPDEILWNRNFKDMLGRTEDGAITIDLAALHDVV